MLNLAGDFSSGVANLGTLGMTYTGNTGTGTFTATSATGKSGTSGSVTIAVGALDHFAFVAASPQTNGVAFSGTNTLTAQDVGNNTVTTFNAATNNVTVTANSPLTGTVSGIHGSNVLNLAGDFSSGVANLGTLGMTYTGNTGTGTFTATSATGKTGTSGGVVINPGALASFTFVAASPQTDGVAFSGTNTLTAKDASGNTITNFSASSNNVTITPTSLAGAVSFTSGATGDVLNTSGDFTNGQANLSSLGMTYTGNTGTGTFTATSATGKSGTSGSVTIAVGALDHFAFVAASPQTNGVAFTGTNTLTAQDVGNNTITNFNASTNNVTVTANSPLTGSVSGIHGSNVLNLAGDFSSGVANLGTLGMTYTGNTGTGTFTATSATGKSGTSGSVTIAVGALDHFAFVAASPQTNGVAFSGTNTLTAQDVGNNTVTTFNAATNNVTVTANSPLTGTVSGIHGSNVLNLAGDFSSGVANLGTLGMTYTGNTGTGTFTATSATGKTGTSGGVVINPGALASFTFVAASPQTDGVAFSGTNTLTAKDASGNTITNFSASSNNVTITPTSLAGAVSFTSGATGDVLNTSGDFTNGQANLSSLGMTYTGNTGTGTFTATSATGKSGTSGSVTIAVGALDHFAFVAASPQTNGVAFTGTNTLTAQDVGNNTITNFNASTNNVTVTANSPLTGSVSGIHGSNVLNLAGDFSSGVANLGTLGMTYTGNTGTGTFTATSATGKSGTSGSVTIAVGALDHFAFVAASPQTNGVAFSGTNTLTAQDVGNNTVTTFNAATNNVTVTANSPLTGTVSGIHGSNVLNLAGDFSSGVANLGTLGMTYTGNTGTGTFKATAASGKTGTSSNVTINSATHTYSGSSNGNIPGAGGNNYYAINTLSSTGSNTNTANGLKPGVAETLTGLTFTLGSTSSTAHSATIGLINSTGTTWTATGLTCTVSSGNSNCTISGTVTVPVGDSINVYAVGNGNHTGSWVTTYTQP